MTSALANVLSAKLKQNRLKTKREEISENFIFNTQFLKETTSHLSLVTGHQQRTSNLCARILIALKAMTYKIEFLRMSIVVNFFDIITSGCGKNRTLKERFATGD